MIRMGTGVATERARERTVAAFARTAGLAPRRARQLAATVVPGPAVDRSYFLTRIGTAGADGPADRSSRAHHRLAALEPTMTPPIATIRVLAIGGTDARCVHGTISLTRRRGYYHAAEAGDLAPLMLLLHHEHYHATHPDAPEADVMAVGLSLRRAVRIARVDRGGACAAGGGVA